MNLLEQHKSYMIVISHHSSRNDFCSKSCKYEFNGLINFSFKKGNVFSCHECGTKLRTNI